MLFKHLGGQPGQGTVRTGDNIRSHRTASYRLHRVAHDSVMGVFYRRREYTGSVYHQRPGLPLWPPAPTSGGLGTTLGTGNPLLTYSYSVNPYDYYPYGAVAAALTTTIAVGVGVNLGLWTLTAIIIGVTSFAKQKRRKARCGPTAAFYREGWTSSSRQPLFGVPLLFHSNEPTT